MLIWPAAEEEWRALIPSSFWLSTFDPFLMRYFAIEVLFTAAAWFRGLHPPYHHEGKRRITIHELKILNIMWVEEGGEIRFVLYDVSDSIQVAM